MRKIIIFYFLIAVLIGIGFIVVLTTPGCVKKTSNKSSSSGFYLIEEVELNKHKYIIRRSSGGGILHSPDCSCRKKIKF